MFCTKPSSIKLGSFIPNNNRHDIDIVSNGSTVSGGPASNRHAIYSLNLSKKDNSVGF